MRTKPEVMSIRKRISGDTARRILKIKVIKYETRLNATSDENRMNICLRICDTAVPYAARINQEDARAEVAVASGAPGQYNEGEVDTGRYNESK
jgi:hypothetical protein